LPLVRLLLITRHGARMTDTRSETDNGDQQRRPQPPPDEPIDDGGEDQLSPARERRKTARQRDGEQRGDVIAENISDP
jgi:hypothetical protein